MVYIVIALFSIIGACSRFLVSLFVDAPFYTVIVNLIGAYALGFCTTHLPKHNFPFAIKTGITTGFLGSFTTFSALSKDTVDLYLSGNVVLFVAYLLITILGGLCCTYFGMKRGEQS
ncbi:fluoride efflux transporter FluC [Macrococcoides caseolyticum]|uniref:fluoride efflux transporter FluC n=1 Tax=Macrococcoides caseolyticum TaxID=69966 RepID=UPI001F3EC3A3|nr:CrcB family protein [Macrococcus caseolyticus]MCE4957981.1 CrcB family protein [Macrococcus caseolyticus]